MTLLQPLIEMFGLGKVLGGSFGIVMVLLAFILHASKVSTVGSVVGSGLGYLKFTAALMIFLVLTGVVSIHPDQVVELWNTVTSIDWRTIWEAVNA